MKFRKDYQTKKDYIDYVKEQNIVGDYPADQTAKIDYNEYVDLQNKTILDVGCRDGKFINRFSKNNEVYGIDISENALTRAANQYGFSWTIEHIKLMDIQDKNFKNPFDIKFDFINFSHVIEHLLDADQALENIKTMMLLDSYLFIVIPGDIPRFKDVYACMKNQPYHEIFWESTEDIRNFLEESGFDILKLDEYNLSHNDGEWRVLCKIKK